MMDGTDQIVTTPEPPNVVTFIAPGLMRGILPVSPIVGPFDVFFVGTLGQFILAETDSPLVKRLSPSKPSYYTIGAVMAPGEDGKVSISSFMQMAKTGKLRYRYVKLTKRLKQRIEEAESLCDQHGASPEHMFLRAEDVSRPSGDGRNIEFVELSYGGILPVEARSVVPMIRKQVAAYGWDNCPVLTMTIEEVVERIRAAEGQVRGWDYEGFDLSAPSIGD